MLRLVSLFGVLVILGLCWLMSVNRRAIRWRLVGTGLAIQAVLGFLFLYWEEGNAALRSFGGGVKRFLDLSMSGTSFIWGPLSNHGAVEKGLGQGFIFAVQVLPTLIFFSSFMAVLYHLGIMQAVVRVMAAVMVRVMGTSGSESLSACANIFVGQTEAPLLVKPFLPRMTRSELNAIMVGGFATIAGGVFVLYTSFGIDPGHLMVASVMAAPAGLVCAKLVYPETEQSETMGTVVRSVEKPSSNVVEAAASGAIDGLQLALNVAAMLIAFLGLVAVIDWLLAMATSLVDWFRAMGMPAEQAPAKLPPLTLGKILGWVFSPLAAVMGASVEVREVLFLGELLGTKLTLTELVAYQQLGAVREAGLATGVVDAAGVAEKLPLSPRTALIASFALCGFANLGSVAIQIGGLGAMAPERRKDLASLAMRAMLVGALTTCLTAALAGVLAKV